MPSRSQKQHDMFQIVAKSKDFAEKMDIPQSVAKDFLAADKKAGLWQDKPKSKKKEKK